MTLSNQSNKFQPQFSATQDNSVAPPIAGDENAPQNQGDLNKNI